ncbi:MAG: M20/M25/M40 family metallo-hydrolase [Euryarchaeota archaeon]|nr:M20/M25/M40 family metallo-hydrolase [Euryarchaeota archaeon]
MADETLALAKKLISVPSVFGQEHEIAEFIASRLKGDVELQEVDGSGPNVVARSEGDSRFPSILLCGHMDTVPPPHGYGADPYKPAVKAGRLYGLGSGDMKGGLACAIQAYNRIAVDGDIPTTFLGTSDEEGNCKGVFRYLNNRPRHDLAIVLEPSGLKAMLGCRGRYVLEIVVKGKAAHGARPEQGVNAIDETAKAIKALQGLKVRSHGILGKGSKCLLKIEGGGESLSVPDRCTIRLDRHVVPGDTKDGLWREVGALLSKAGLSEGYELRWMPRPTPFLEPYVTKKTALVMAFLSSTGAAETYGTSVGDYNALGAAMPTAVFGPSGENWHALGEFVDIESLSKVDAKLSAFCESLRKCGR